MTGTTERTERDDALEGIVDHRRSYPDPELSRDDDARIARRLQELARDRDLAGLLDEHWLLVGKHPELAARFTTHEMRAGLKCAPVLAAIDEARGTQIGPADRVLEVGCGTAALSAAIAARGADVVASDVSLRWLVLAQKRLEETAAGRVELVACAAEVLPFPDDSFDLVAASDVIEHVESPEQFAREAARVLRSGGLLFLATPNRYSLGLEPHVRLWGVGYLPRKAAERYVAAVRKVSYDHVHLLSARALRHVLAGAGFEVTVVTPEVPEATQRMYRGIELELVLAYNRARRVAPLNAALLAVGPFFHVFARKRG